jgi:hypothetical protein
LLANRTQGYRKTSFRILMRCWLENGYAFRKQRHTSNYRRLQMFLRKSLPVFALSIAMASASFAMPAQDDQSAKQDMKDAGHDAKNAAKDTGHATKKTAKKTGHAVKHTSKKVAHKTAEKTDEGARKVEDKTDPNR